MSPMIANRKRNKLLTIRTLPRAGIELSSAETMSFRPSSLDMTRKGLKPLNTLSAFNELIFWPGFNYSNILVTTTTKSIKFQPELK